MTALSALSPIHLLNKYRETLSMIPLQENESLGAAAANHAYYLSELGANNVKTFEDAHEEKAGKIGFTGKSVAQRAMYAGYPHQATLENISLGTRDAKSSIDLLLSGIYHRFGFLTFDKDEIGFAEKNNIYVYNLGRSDLSETCVNPPHNALIQAPKDCDGTAVTAEFWQNMCDTLPSKSRYQAPHKQACPNGQLLKKTYLRDFCNNPPEGSLLKGNGRYYKLCQPEQKIRAQWFEQLCDTPPKKAAYDWDGRYYQICQTKVHAKWLEQRCRRLQDKDIYQDSGRYFTPCAKNTTQAKIRAEFMDELDANLQKRNPRSIAWPVPNSQAVKTRFYGEIPNPLPDLKESGYPISLQFNPYYVKNVKIKQATIRYKKLSSVLGQKKEQWFDVEYRFLNKKSDPHKKMTDLEFAWFPLDVLENDTLYEVKVKALVDGKLDDFRWTFRTEQSTLKRLFF
ncbi:MAG: CAP domain-containing protein [bacterium]